MPNSKTESFDKTEDPLRPEVIISKEIFGIFIFISVSASTLGFFILLSILAVSIPQTTLLFPHGFILGLLLLSSGLILLLSLIILNQESKKTIRINSSSVNQNKQID
ncbi:MAG: hypothetical protein ACFFB5_14905 [Promethearchaeota archaeon]